MSLHQSSSTQQTQNAPQSTASHNNPNSTGQNRSHVTVQSAQHQGTNRQTTVVQASSAGLTIEQISCVCEVLQEKGLYFKPKNIQLEHTFLSLLGRNSLFNIHVKFNIYKIENKLNGCSLKSQLSPSEMRVPRKSHNQREYDLVGLG